MKTHQEYINNPIINKDGSPQPWRCACAVFCLCLHPKYFTVLVIVDVVTILSQTCLLYTVYKFCHFFLITSINYLNTRITRTVCDFKFVMEIKHRILTHTYIVERWTFYLSQRIQFSTYLAFHCKLYKDSLLFYYCVQLYFRYNFATD